MATRHSQRGRKRAEHQALKIIENAPGLLLKIHFETCIENNDE